MSQSLGVQTSPSITPPAGLDEIRTVFGDIFQYILPDHTLAAAWQAEFLATAKLPFPLVLSWDHSRTVNSMTCHKLLVNTFDDVFKRIQDAGLQSNLTSFGGCFSFRPQRTGTKLSTHAWGIAIDLDPESNEQGTAGNMNMDIITIFRDAGFEWGGDWQGRLRDPMHFQFCTGY
jgi:hypothetical protein